MHKITVKFTDGATYTGTTPSEVVNNMKNASPFTKDQTLSEYMHGYANRLFNLTGQYVDHTSVAGFIVTLSSTEEVEYLRVEKREDN